MSLLRESRPCIIDYICEADQIYRAKYRVERLLFKHSVVIFPNQASLTAAGQHALTQRFDPQVRTDDFSHSTFESSRLILLLSLRQSSTDTAKLDDPKASLYYILIFATSREHQFNSLGMDSFPIPSFCKVSLHQRSSSTRVIKPFTGPRFQMRIARRASRDSIAGISMLPFTSAILRK